MPDYDPLTISDEELKQLPPAERGAVYKARRAASGAPPPPGAAAPVTGGSPSGAGGAPTAATPVTGESPSGAGGAPTAAAPVTGESPSGAGGAPTAAAAVPSVGGPSGGGSTPAAAAPAPAPVAAKPPPPAAEKPKEPPFVAGILESIPDASWQWRHGYAEIKVPRDALLDAARSLRSAGFDYLSFVSEVDWQDRLELVYHLFAYDFLKQPLGVILRTDLPREAMPSVASLTSVWPGAEFMEREAFEMMGISFLGHPDLRRILLPDDFVGFPMRRDYETDYEYITVKQLVHESD